MVQAFEVFKDGKQIDKLFYSDSDKVTEEDVKKSLIDHDGYDPDIEVRREGEASPQLEEKYTLKDIHFRSELQELLKKHRVNLHVTNGKLSATFFGPKESPDSIHLSVQRNVSATFFDSNDYPLRTINITDVLTAVPEK